MSHSPTLVDGLAAVLEAAATEEPPTACKHDKIGIYAESPMYAKCEQY